MIIAAKNGDNHETVLELSDLMYHLMVLMVNEGITLEEVEAELESAARRRETSNNSIRLTKIPENRKARMGAAFKPVPIRAFLFLLYSHVSKSFRNHTSLAVNSCPLSGSRMPAGVVKRKRSL